MSEALMFDETSLAWSSIPEVCTPPAASQLDYELAREIAGGDMQAFEELYNRYHRRVYSLCLRMTNNVAEAEDLTQEIFIHIYHKIGSFRGESTIMTWLHRVTVNRVLMHFRRNKVRRESVADTDALPEPKLKTSETLNSQILEVDRVALNKAISELPPGYRAVLILHDIEGYEHTEIARMNRIAVGTSKSQLHKARLKLRELLSQE
ncbi:MAG TPA: RNA polymerase sigma factor [Pyrinomonadaceae bacterium]|nr:RNA polymerase sigma factor [Pyrinomonadaceae bacterium]